MTGQSDAMTTGQSSAVTNPDDLMTEVEVSRYMKFSCSTLQTWRSAGLGPAFLKVARNSIRYRRGDVDAWLDAKRQHTLESRRT